MKKLAKITGYTEGSAGVVLGKLKRKLKKHVAEQSTIPIATPKKSSTTHKMPTSGKRSTSGSAHDETPSKKKRGLSKKTIANNDEEKGFREVEVKTEKASGLLLDTEGYFASSENYGAGYEAYEGHGGYEDESQGI
jgi:hypothetical protein